MYLLKIVQTRYFNFHSMFLHYLRLSSESTETDLWVFVHQVFCGYLFAEGGGVFVLCGLFMHNVFLHMVIVLSLYWIHA